MRIVLVLTLALPADKVVEHEVGDAFRGSCFLHWHRKLVFISFRDEGLFA